MADLETENVFESIAQKNEAKRNAQQIQSNILKLIRIFRRDDMYAKLQREFRDHMSRLGQNDIAGFNTQFTEMKSLWQTRLCTSLEEHIRMQEQVETSGKRVKDLNKTLEDKKE